MEEEKEHSAVGEFREKTSTAW